MAIVIGKTKEPGGCWSNMAGFPVVCFEKSWRTNEHLFQALRFTDEKIREEIRSIGSPMQAKWHAKARKDQMTVVPMSEQDLDNMRFCLRLKIDQHPQHHADLLASGDKFIVEDCTKRQGGSGLFWGAASVRDEIDGHWEGQNWLGKLWMELRSELQTATPV